MRTNSLETTDIFRGAFFLCKGGDLSEIRFRKNGKQIASFLFTGQDLIKHDKEYRNGHALVNPLQFRESLNHLRDILFEKLREHTALPDGYAVTRGKTRYDRKRNNRAYQKRR